MVTPICLLGIIYTVAFPLIFILNRFIDVFTPTDFNMMMTLAFFVMVFLLGRAVKRKHRDVRRGKPLQYIYKMDIHEQFIWFIFFIGMICKFINFRQVAEIRGLGNMKRGEFGVFANLGYLAQVTTPYIVYFGIKKKKLLNFVMVAAELVILTLFEVKGTLLITLLHVVLFNFLMDNRVTLGKMVKRGILLGAFGIIAFIAIYAYLPTIVGQANGDNLVEMAFLEFVHYLFSPFVCANEYYLMPNGNIFEKGYRVIFNPIIALQERFFGNRNYPDTIIHYWARMSNARTSNVGGLFSETVYQVGYLYAFLYIAAIVLIIYLVFNRAYYKGKWVNGASAILSRWVLCFFANYMAPTTAFQIMIYCFVFDWLICHAPRIIQKRYRIVLRKGIRRQAETP